MISLLARLDSPLFVMDRRHFWNGRKRALFVKQGVNAEVPGQVEEPFDMTNGMDPKVDQGLTVISFFRLVAIVAVPMAILLTPLLMIINGRTDRQLDLVAASVMREVDVRYLPNVVYKIEHEDIITKVRDNKIHNDEQDIRIAKLEMQIMQIQMQQTLATTPKK